METKGMLTCPNCGAAATNHKNCEYCNSLLVRFVEKGIEIDQSRYGKDAWVFPGLNEMLETLSIKYKIFNGGDTFLIIADEIPLQGDFSISIMKDLSPQQIKNFKNTTFFPLFTDNGDHYFMDYGKDLAGTANIITQLLVEVFGISPNTDLINYSLWYGNTTEKYSAGKTVPLHKTDENAICENEETPWYKTWWGYTILAVCGALLYIIIKFLDS